MDTVMSFEFKGLARADMGLVQLKAKIKPLLRLQPNEEVDLVWLSDPCLPESLFTEEEFWRFWDNAEVHDNWTTLHMQVIIPHEYGAFSELTEITPPHKYVTPTKSSIPKKPVSKTKQAPTRRSPRLSKKKNQSQSASKQLFIDLDEEEAYVPQFTQQTQSTVAENIPKAQFIPEAEFEHFDPDFWVEATQAASVVEDDQYVVQLPNEEPDECHPEQDLENFNSVYDSEEQHENEYKEFLRRAETGGLADNCDDPNYGQVEVENDEEEDHYGDVLSSDGEDEGGPEQAKPSGPDCNAPDQFNGPQANDPCPTTDFEKEHADHFRQEEEEDLFPEEIGEEFDHTKLVVGTKYVDKNEFKKHVSISV